MNALKYKITLLFLSITFFCYAQQQKKFPYYHYPYTVNSAVSGLLKSSEIFAGSSITEKNIDGYLSSFYLSGIWTVNNKNFALGVSYLNNKIGVFSDNLLKVSYAYRLNFGDSYNNYERNLPKKFYEHSLSMGIDAGISFFEDDLISLDMIQDPRLAENKSDLVPVFGASVMYNHPFFFLGLSIDNIVNIRKKNSVEYIRIKQEKLLYLYGGYRIWLAYDSLLLTPNILIRHNFGTSTIIDYNLNFDYNDILEGGLGYIDSGTFNLSFGVKIFEKKLSLIYATYIHTKSNFYGNSHELMLKYEF